MMKKMLIWVLAIMLCLSMVPSFAEEVENPSQEIEAAGSEETVENEDVSIDSEIEGDVEIEDSDNTDDTDNTDNTDDTDNTDEETEDEENGDSEPTLEDTALVDDRESDEIFTFKASDLNQVCLDETEEPLSYIKITDMSSAYGSLWYDYDGSKEAKVNYTTSYYRSSSSTSSKTISKISFVPKSTFDGKAKIYYTGYSEKKKSFEGMIIVNVTVAEEKGDLEKIIYYTEPGKKITLDASDINSVCRNAGFSLNYITFELPDASSEGVLYYDYKASNSKNTAVSKKTKYYKNVEKTTVIDKVTLVIAKGAEENFDLTYYAYDADDEKYEGVLRFKIESDDSNYGISYEVTGECVFFTPSDFNAICKEETGTKLSHVKFDTPSVGSLYYDYEDEEGEKAKVSTSKAYYYGSKSPNLYLVAYVPKAGYEGTVSVDYEAFSVDDDSFFGTVNIKVSTSDIEKAEDIEYSVKNSSYKTFSNTSFTSACTKATGEKLEYIKFALPSSSAGTLYYKYSKSKDENEKVMASTRYYADEADYIKYVTFVPKSSYKGNVSISYTGYTVEGTRFTGKIKINVTGTTTSSTSKDDEYDDSPDAITYKAEKGKAVKFDAEDFFDVCDDYMGDDLSYVEFVNPSSTSGILYYDFGGKNEEKLKDGVEVYYEDEEEDYLLSDVSFVPAKAANITIRYTAYTVEDDDYDGTVVIKVEATPEGTENFEYKRGYKEGTFSDVDENAWYGSRQTEAIKLAYRYGLMSGREDGSFDPLGNMTVAEALTIASRVHDIYYNNETEFDTTGDPWYSDYVSYAITNKIIKRTQFTSYDRKITREEMASVFANIIPRDAMEEINDVDVIPDVDEDNEYYSEILYLYNVGVLSGSDEKGTFKPGDYISRAEVSAIIVRVVAPKERREIDF